MNAFSSAFFAGLLFSIGLGLSGMTDANKVLGFLDLSGKWDPSLAFVMVGAIGIHLLFYRLILKRSRPLLDSEFHLPSRRTVDAKLIAGAGIFGVGWGLGGFCPGPALVSVSGFGAAASVFVGCMLFGMLLHRLFHRSEQPASSANAG